MFIRDCFLLIIYSALPLIIGNLNDVSIFSFFSYFYWLFSFLVFFALCLLCSFLEWLFFFRKKDKFNGMTFLQVLFEIGFF